MVELNEILSDLFYDDVAIMSVVEKIATLS